MRVATRLREDGSSALVVRDPRAALTRTLACEGSGVLRHRGKSMPFLSRYRRCAQRTRRRCPQSPRDLENARNRSSLRLLQKGRPSRSDLPLYRVGHLEKISGDVWPARSVRVRRRRGQAEPEPTVQGPQWRVAGRDVCRLLQLPALPFRAGWSPSASPSSAQSSTSCGSEETIGQHDARRNGRGLLGGFPELVPQRWFCRECPVRRISAGAQ